jgi:hypothetical protein
MRISRPSPSMVVAGAALFISLGGTSVAAVSYASRAGSVDGKSAVSASSSLSHAAGRLVATSKSGTNKGRLPGKFLSGVAKTTPIRGVFDVADNAPGAPQAVAIMSGLGTVSATCNDQNTGLGVEDPVTVISFINQSGDPANVARRAGVNDGAVGVFANQTVASLSIAGSNTFTFQIEHKGRQAFISGAVRQDGVRTAAATCVVYGLVYQAS